VRHYGQFPVGRDLEIELANGERIPVEMVWSDGRFAGLKFLAEVDLSRIVGFTTGGLPKRGLRLRTVLEGVLSFGSDLIPVTIRNLSQQGAGIVCRQKLSVRQLITLETDDLSPLDAEVCWRKGDEYGLVFKHVLSTDLLARILARSLRFLSD
jgi:hypothetical protein